MFQEYWYILLTLTIVSLVLSRWQGVNLYKCLIILILSVAAFYGASELVMTGKVDISTALLVYGMIVLFMPVIFNTVEWRKKE